MALFSSIPLFPRASYEVDVDWHFLEDHIKRAINEDGLDLNPPFQRAHVWTRSQQIAYVEYVMQGGEVGKNITFNAIGWNSSLVIGSYVIIDGKQRLEAVRSFLRNDFRAFNHYRSEYTDRMRRHMSFKWRICSLPCTQDLLRLYLNINAGGTPHTKAELNKVRAMLKSIL